MATLPKPPALIENFVVLIQYTVTATNNKNSSITASINNMIQFETSQDENQDLTPYNQLTEEMVLSWIQTDLNLVINLQANLDGQIESQINPPIVPETTPLPWLSTSLKRKK